MMKADIGLVGFMMANYSVMKGNVILRFGVTQRQVICTQNAREVELDCVLASGSWLGGSMVDRVQPLVA